MAKETVKKKMSKDDKEAIQTLVNGIMNGFMWEQIRPLYMQYVKQNTLKSLIKDTVGPMIQDPGMFDDNDRKVFKKHKEVVHKKVLQRINNGNF